VVGATVLIFFAVAMSMEKAIQEFSGPLLETAQRISHDLEAAQTNIFPI
jgi:hypothetical protein